MDGWIDEMGGCRAVFLFEKDAPVVWCVHGSERMNARRYDSVGFSVAPGPRETEGTDDF